MLSQSDVEKAWVEAFQIRKGFTDYFGTAVPKELLAFTDARLQAINELTKPKRAFDKYGVGDLLAMDTGTGPRPHPLTEEEIIQTAIERDHRNGRWLAIGAFLVLALVALYQPVHTWLHRHVELFAGILIGSLAEAAVWIACIWKRL
jgi:hypothetical protein